MEMARLIQYACALSATLLLTTIASAQTTQFTTTARDRQSINVTVYNSNIGLIRETRRLSLPSGRVALRFSDVAAQIMPQTVHLASLTSASSLGILEQNYQYDLLNPAKLLEKYVGQEVTLVLRRYENNTEILTPVQATLVNSDDTRGDLQGWVTLTNTSGVGFADARLQLVAGDVNRVKDERELDRMKAVAGRLADEASSAFQEQAFFEYHLYTLGRPTSIREQETKQVSLLEASSFNVAKQYVINGQHYYYTGYNSPGAPIKEKVGVYMQFRNSQLNKLGMPLPAGTVRLYKKDDNGGQQFIGEDRIDHTPKDEDVRVKVGDAFDVVAERKQLEYKVIVSGHLYEYAYEVKIRNHKNAPVTVIVNEPIGGDWEMVSSSFEAEKTAAFAARFKVPVDKDGEARLTYRVRVKY